MPRPLRWIAGARSQASVLRAVVERDAEEEVVPAARHVASVAVAEPTDERARVVRQRRSPRIVSANHQSPSAGLYPAGPLSMTVSLMTSSLESTTARTTVEPTGSTAPESPASGDTFEYSA